MKTEKLDDKLEQKLLRMVIRSDKSGVREVLKQNSEWNDKRLGRILWHAVKIGTLETAAMLVEAGADVNMKNPFDKSGFNFLHQLMTPDLYSKFGIDLVDLIVQHGADVNACTNEFQSVLHRAFMEHQSVEMIEKLFKFGARATQFSLQVLRDRKIYKVDQSFHDRYSFDNETMAERVAGAFACCCAYTMSYEKSTSKCAKFFLDMGFPINVMESDGYALVFAVYSQSFQLVKLLVDRGFDVNKATPEGILPLYAASRHPESDIAELLILAGAEVNALSDEDDVLSARAIHAACKVLSVANIKMLLRHGADLNLTDNQGRTPFSLIECHEFSVRDAHQIIIKHMAVLEVKGISINTSDMTLIRSRFKMHEYYTKCFEELERMKDYKTINDISVFCIFQEDLRKVLFKTRNYNFEEISYELLKDQFPYNDEGREFRFNKQLTYYQESMYFFFQRNFRIYHEEVNILFKNIKINKILLRDREEALVDSLKSVLPYIPLERIVYHLYMNF